MVSRLCPARAFAESRRMGYFFFVKPANVISRDFTKIIIQSARKTLGQRRKTRKTGYEWWTNELGQLRRQCSAARRVWQRRIKRGGLLETIAYEEFQIARALYRRRQDETELACFRGHAKSGNKDPWGLAYRVASSRKRLPANVVNGTKFAEGHAGTDQWMRPCTILGMLFARTTTGSRTLSTTSRCGSQPLSSL